jgi:acetolactate synthase-1/2/3 large subunit
LRARRGADALAAALVRAGVKHVFTLSGNHVMPVFDAALDAGLELIHTRHEAACVHMADAWARLTGEPGIALVTGGPGHANAVSALYTARMADSPVVLLSGHAASAELGHGAFQEMAQAEIAAPLAKSSWVCAGAEAIGRDVARALRTARSGRPGPVHVSFPVDHLEARTDAPDPAAGELAPQEAPFDGASLDGILARLRAARKPLVVCGPAAATKRGRARLAALEDAAAIPAIAMESPRGIADPSLGRFGSILSEADCVLLLGKRRDFTLKFGRGLACEFVEPENGATYDYLAAIDALAERGRGAKAARSGWLDEVHAAIAYRPREWDALACDPPHPVQVLRPLQALLDAHPDSVFVSDGGEFGQWAQACLRAPHRVINGVAGAIGMAIPFAAAARLAQPQAPVIAASGDGAFGFHAAEIDTAVRYKLGFVAIVGNDARWNAEYQIQLRSYGAARAKGCELLPTRYDRVAQAFGGFGEHVTGASQVLAAARRAQASGLPACLDVPITGAPAPTY